MLHTHSKMQVALMHQKDGDLEVGFLDVHRGQKVPRTEGSIKRPGKFLTKLLYLEESDEKCKIQDAADTPLPWGQ